ncbi:Holliday junction branch migration protein RuvA [Schaalia sp. Marseille-Q2122]|uniref:Holliday junction branch migration protein RuvA n=1 Tax=Schaalia sp. Marseille-Q2122 TaxID=2736604 RepID=UPI0015890C87|nr:Holliday junction branch migration protein RuvA [Schaalia sp. Marseille-Q2122]
MIAQLRGVVEHVGLDQVILMVGGIGWSVHVTPAAAQGMVKGIEVTVHTAMIVREDSMTLYGFASFDEREVFERLLGVSGIGPRTALAALSVLNPDDLRRAVRDSDVATLQRIPGVGKKSAQRMVLEIGDKLGIPAHVDPLSTPAAQDEAAAEVKSALIQLGWSDAVASKALDSLAGQGLGASDLLRAALLKLGGQRG